MLTKAFIPYRGYYSTPFSRWQGAMANEHAIVLAAETSKRFLMERKWDAGMFDYLILGMTIGQPQWFYGSPWAAAMIGAASIPGMLISQACTTSTTCIYQAGVGVETGLYQNVYTLMTDRCSNGPHTVWPNPQGPGGKVISENWLMDNFSRDPWARGPMIQTAENVARETAITREECDRVSLRRYEQYLDALADDRAFQRGYLFPVDVKAGKNKTFRLEKDEGIMETTAAGLAGLKPVIPEGTHTFGSQTHPADGNAAVIVTTREKAKELSADPEVEIQILSYGYGRAKKGFMAMATAPAAKMALDRAGITADQVKTVKTHNPFAANDIYLARELGLDINAMNNYGSTIVYGHPQAPTAARNIMEGIEETVKLGGGYLLWAGCAAGDTGASLVIKVH
ncbi:MAG: thiolase family protein [Deltaproteobacteria bacterium]|nr:thiolase family protein [Deltaproteobacteria bacterium]